MKTEWSVQDIDDVSSVFSLAVASGCASAPRIFAGTELGLFRSGEPGRAYQPISQQLGTFPAVTVVAALTSNKAPLILAGGIPGIIARSLDEGETWQLSKLGVADAMVTVLAMSPDFADDGCVLAGTAEDGVFRSMSSGRLWEPVNFGLIALRVWHLAISPAWERDQTAFAVVGEDVFRTTNGARAWKHVAEELENTAPQVIVLSPDFEHDGTAFLGTQGRGVWRSTDKGQHWAQIGNQQEISVNCLLCSSNYSADQTLYAGTVEAGLLCSHDGGEHWEPIDGTDDMAIWSLAETRIQGERRLLVGTQDQGIVSLQFE